MQTAQAVEDVGVPKYVCDSTSIFSGSFEREWQAQNSAGFGGASGSSMRTVFVPGIGSRSYFLFAASGTSEPRPLLIALHGAAGPGQASNAAIGTRDSWVAEATAAGFVVIAPIASGSQGGWIPGADFPTIDVQIADALSAYTIDTARTYLWGFSAGGHVAHGMALLRDPNRYAAYAVNAGALEAYAGASAPLQASRTVPLAIHVGTSDPLFPFAESDRDRFLNAGWNLGSTLRFEPFAGGHTYSSVELAKIWRFLCRRAVLP
jgi:poly(3-hydroxybutyrate) depolymerase